MDARTDAPPAQQRAATSARDLVTAILSEDDQTEHFVPTRYPSTYARDFFRTHVERITGMRDDAGSVPTPSRGEAGPMIKQYAERTGQTYGEVMLAFADGYLDQWRVRVSAEARAEALEAYFERYANERERYGLPPG